MVVIRNISSRQSFLICFKSNWYLSINLLTSSSRLLNSINPNINPTSVYRSIDRSVCLSESTSPICFEWLVLLGSCKVLSKLLIYSIREGEWKKKKKSKKLTHLESWIDVLIIIIRSLEQQPERKKKIKKLKAKKDDLSHLGSTDDDDDDDDGNGDGNDDFNHVSRCHSTHPTPSSQFKPYQT